MGMYTFHDVTLEIQPGELERKADLARLWSNLSWDQTTAEIAKPVGHVRLHLAEQTMSVPQAALPAFTTESFSGFEQGDDFYLTDRESLFHLQLTAGQGDAYLAPSFFSKPLMLQQTFWTFGLLKLLRRLGFYTLHSAGLVNPDGRGVLAIGASGTGKTTLALGLVRQGWRYLSDDAVLVHRRDSRSEVSALALREHFYIDSHAAPAHGDLTLGREVTDSGGGRRRRVYLDRAYAGQKTSACVPDVLLFTRIVPQERSELLAVDQVTALKRLLDASGEQLFDRLRMPRHLDVLRGLVTQTRCYEFRAGRDLRGDASRAAHLLRRA